MKKVYDTIVRILSANKRFGGDVELICPSCGKIVKVKAGERIRTKKCPYCGSFARRPMRYEVVEGEED